MCEVNGCSNDVNRDGLCLKHKLKTVRLHTEGLARERNGEDVTGGVGTREYVRDMYETRRADGRPDPIPMNKEAAKFAPAAGVSRPKNYKEVNGGL